MPITVVARSKARNIFTYSCTGAHVSQSRETVKYSHESFGTRDYAGEDQQQFTRSDPARSNTGIVGSYPTQGMDVRLWLFFICIVCVGSDLAMGWSPVQGVLPIAYNIPRRIGRNVYIVHMSINMTFDFHRVLKN
jgi:hypothetical protein